MVNYAHLALGVTMAALAAAMFVRARRAGDGRTERSARFAGTMLSVAAVAFLVAFALSAVTAR